MKNDAILVLVSQNLLTDVLCDPVDFEIFVLQVVNVVFVI